MCLLQKLCVIFGSVYETPSKEGQLSMTAQSGNFDTGGFFRHPSRKFCIDPIFFSFEDIEFA
jgi:hypothetical protein